MDDRTLVTRLLQLGAAAHRQNRAAYAMPSDDPELHRTGAATIANWLEELGRHRLIGDVQPCFTSSGAGFRFQVTDKAVEIVSNATLLTDLLNTVSPAKPEYDIFISYATGDSALADELRSELEGKGLSCFMAEKDIPAAAEWQEVIRQALCGSQRVLLLLTPRSVARPWVLMETGAAWALGKPLIPAIVHIATTDLADPVRKHQARVIETTAQRKALVKELIGS